jgi:lysophospholipase L1-like esterase
MWRIARPTLLGAADPKLGNSARQAPVKEGETPATGAADGKLQISQVIRDFGPRGADYTFGPDWKNGENIKSVNDALQIDTTQAGGAGMVLNGANIAPQGQTHLALRARVLPGNAATTLAVNIMRAADKGGKREISFDLSGLKESEWTTLTQPLGAGQFDRVDQIQLQGTNWAARSSALKIQIDAVGTTSLDANANAKALEAIAKNPSVNPAPKGKPSEAGWGFYPNFPQAWMGAHNRFLERTKQNATKKINIVFFGDSIMQGWGDTGKATWEKNYAPLGAVNYGIGGDSTRQVLWRIQNGEVDGISPKLVVLKIGTNNIYGDNNAGSNEEIAEGVRAIVTTLRAKLPQTKILLLGLLPRQNDFFSTRTKNINAQISKLDNGQTVRFLDMSDAFHTELGKVKKQLYNTDQLHLEAPGYEVWATTMAPLFEQMMK